MPDVNLRVFYDKADTVAEMADGLVDSDPLELRDLALNLLHDVEALKAALTEAHSVMDQMQRLDDPQTAVAALIHLDEALAQRDEARAQRDSWRDVVEAAKAWRADLGPDNMANHHRSTVAIITAVDALSTKDGA